MDNKFLEGMRKFLELCVVELQFKSLPKIQWIKNSDLVNGRFTFGTYDPNYKIITINISNRHPMDICRTLAHELVHHKQNINGELDHKSGITGSKHENEANAAAGVIMRKFAKIYPEMFKLRLLN